MIGVCTSQSSSEVSRAAQSSCLNRVVIRSIGGTEPYTVTTVSCRVVDRPLVSHTECSGGLGQLALCRCGACNCLSHFCNSSSPFPASRCTSPPSLSLQHSGVRDCSPARGHGLPPGRRGGGHGCCCPQLLDRGRRGEWGANMGLQWRLSALGFGVRPGGATR